MCGFVARILPPAAPAGLDEVTSALHLIAHRGPDGHGVGVVSLSWCRVVLGQVRLAINDLRELPLPHVFQDVVLAWNGEVYNYRELRAELGDDPPWTTDCDAEVVAHAWWAWGPEMLSRFNGVWGLVLVDRERDEVFVARDRAGEKPVLMALGPRGALHLASEVKALGVELRECPSDELDGLEADCTPAAVPFRGVCYLPPGHYFHLRGPSDLDGGTIEWWSLPSQGDDQADADGDGVLLALLQDAVRLRVPPEVPHGLMLSGGLDSAILRAAANPEHRPAPLYCVTFPEIDNLTWAREAAPGAEVVPVTFTYDDLCRALPKIAWHLDTPATWTAVCQWFLAERMAADGIKVALSGEGADELFWGYSRYRLLWHLDGLRADPVLCDYAPLNDFLLGTDDEVLARLLGRGDGARAAWLIAAYGAPGAGYRRTLVERMARIDWHTTMQMLLRMADRMFMAHGIENRSPFLDHRVIARACALHPDCKIDFTHPKAALRRAAVALGVPQEVAYRRAKRGLAIPWSTWSRGSSGARGAWDRAGFATRMRAAWRQAYKLGEARTEARADGEV